MGHPQASAGDYWQTMLTDAALTAYRLLARAIPAVEEPVFGQRFGLMWELVIHSLADRERYLETRRDDGRDHADLFVENLIDLVAGGLAAPVSARTARALARRPAD